MGTKISAMPERTSLNGNEVVPVVFNGVNYRVSFSGLKDFINAEVIEALQGKANTEHQHAVADITGLEAEIQEVVGEMPLAYLGDSEW